jgi:hypothetical protein
MFVVYTTGELMEKDSALALVLMKTFAATNQLRKMWHYHRDRQWRTGNKEFHADSASTLDSLQKAIEGVRTMVDGDKAEDSAMSLFEGLYNVKLVLISVISSDPKMELETKGKLVWTLGQFDRIFRKIWLEAFQEGVQSGFVNVFSSYGDHDDIKIASAEDSSLQGAIDHAREVAARADGCCKSDHIQLAVWLKELQAHRDVMRTLATAHTPTEEELCGATVRAIDCAGYETSQNGD